MRTRLITVVLSVGTMCLAVMRPAEAAPLSDSLCGFVTISQSTATTQPAQALDGEAKFITSYCKTWGIKRIKVWDGSGDDQQDIKYTGDPRLLPKGTTRGMMVKFYKTIRDAGIECGGTIRPGWIMKDAVNGALVYQSADSYTYSMLAKAQWAANAYGWNEFYCDSTVTPTGDAFDPRPYILFKLKMPNAKFFIENIAIADGKYESYGRFCDPRLDKPIPDDHYHKLIGTMDTFDPTRAQEWHDAAVRGDEIMVYAHWDAPFNRGVFNALSIDAQNR